METCVKGIIFMDFEEVKKIRSNCLAHADNLLKGSRKLIDEELYSIAFHLAVLSLEEVGKSVMVEMGFASPNEQKRKKILKEASEDHIKKLFWALWGPLFGSKDMSGKQMDDSFSLARNIHFDRLAALYVDPTKAVPELGMEMSKEDVSEIIKLTEARIKIEELKKFVEPSEAELNDMQWFAASSDDPRMRKLMFGNKSIEKLKEFDGNSKKWIKWLKQQFDAVEKENRELMQKELNREKVADEDRFKPKWEVRYRVKTISHSIRQSELNKWNAKVDKIKLSLGAKNRDFFELIIDKQLPKDVPLKALWYAAWGDARLFAIALNIATMGYFWWYIPQDVSKFYEKITDLENDAEVGVERNPKLKIDWGHQVLTMNDLYHVAMCYGLLPKGNEKFLGNYVTGLSFLGKNDIHTPFENEIFLQFYNALLNAMIYYKDHKIEETFETNATKIFEQLMPGSTLAVEYLNMAKDLMMHKKLEKPITLSECAMMKVLVDLYLLSTIKTLAERRNQRGGRQ
jgi:AbiV family abortive infection protein